MTYAALIARLRAHAETAGAASFWTGVKTANGVNYTGPFPLVELFILPSALTGATAVQYSIGMGFYAEDAHEGSDEDIIAAQSAMDELTQKFLRQVREEQEWELVDRGAAGGGLVARTPTVRTGTKVGTGLFIDFALSVLALPC